MWCFLKILFLSILTPAIITEKITEQSRITWTGVEISSERMDVAIDKYGNVWVATFKGLFRYNGCAWHQVPVKLPSLLLREIYFDKNNNLWIGFEKSGFVLLKTNGEVVIPKGKTDLADPYRNCIVSAFFESNDHMYIASSIGILKVDYNLEIKESYKFRSQYPHLQYGPHSLNLVKVIKEHKKDNNLWVVGGSMGLCTFDLITKTYKHHPMPRNILQGLAPQSDLYPEYNYSIQDMFVTDHEVFKISWGGGVTVFNLENEKWDHFMFQIYDDSAPLDENVALEMSVINDSIFVAAALKVSMPIVFNYKRKEFIPFNEYFNVEPVPEPSSSIYHHGDQLIVGSFTGISTYRIPGQSPIEISEARICAITTNKRNIYFNDGFTSLPDQIEIDKDENHIDIQISMPFFFDPNYGELHYALNDKKWRISKNPSLSLKNLKGGFHKLSFRLRMNGQDSSEMVYYINKQKKWWELTWTTVIMFISFTIFGGILLWIKNRKIKNKNKKQIEVIRRIERLEMETLQSRMNPHFLFNSLNSIKSYIVKNEKKLATDYINDFAQLLRDILHYSNSLYIPLENELDIVKTYIKLEQQRFSKPFVFNVKVDPEIPLDSIYIPSLLLQPFVENAVWHGISHKSVQCHLEIDIRQTRDEVKIQIIDNGIGRRLSGIKNLKKKKNNRSAGIELAIARLRLMYGEQAGIVIIDIPEDQGTEVIINFKLKNFNQNYLNELQK